MKTDSDEWDVPEDVEEDEAPSTQIHVGELFTSGNVIINHSLNALSQADPGEIQKIAASQIALLNSYYNTSLGQAKSSFRWALVAAGVGLAFLLGSIASTLTVEPRFISAVAAIGGVVSEFVAAINFWLYGKTLQQLNHFHDRLDQLQRFLLANSICESLEPRTQQEARYKLVATIANFSESRAAQLDGNSGPDKYGDKTGELRGAEQGEAPNPGLNRTTPLRGAAG